MSSCGLPLLHGHVVVLRPMNDDEIDAVAERLATDPQVAPWFGIKPPVIAGWLKADSVNVYSIETEGTSAGIITFEEECDPDYRSAGIDIGLFSHAIGRGAGPDALRTLAAYLIDERGHHRLTIDPAAANVRAVRAYQKVGFRPVGVMRQYERGPDGTWHDNLLMDMLASELVRNDGA